MLRVCHLISGDLWAGAEVMACHLVQRLAGYPDLSLSVVLLNEGRLADEVRRGGIDCHVVDERCHSFPGILSTVGGILRRNPPHVIHAHRYKENLLAFLLSLAHPGVRLVSTQHGLPESGGATRRPQGFKSHLNLFLLARFFRTVAVSRDIREWLTQRMGFDPERVSVIHNGIVLPAGEARVRRTGEFVVGSSGRLFPVKDYPLMVQIARKVTSVYPSARFLLAGEGPERARIEADIEALGLEKVFVLEGHLDDVVSFYRRLDVYLNTSTHEGIPMSVLEAMAHGLPVVAPRVGGIGEIVEDGIEGFLVGGRDPGDFARKCLLLQENEVLWRRMSQAARAKAQGSFSVDRMVEAYRRLYFSLAPATSGVRNSGPERVAAGRAEGGR